MKTLILALGNPILSDDAVGWEVADRLSPRMADVDVIKEGSATMDLIPTLAEYDRVIIVDAIQLGNVPLGSVHKFSLADFTSTIRYSCPHDINFASSFALAKEMGYKIPDDIVIFAVEVKELLKFAEGCSPEIAARLDGIADEIAQQIAN